MKQSIFKQSLAVALLCALLAITPVSSTLAQEETGPILTIYEVKVKHGHESKWRAAAKAWNQCYGENGGQASWNAWSRVQGEGNVFVFSVMADNWAEFGQQDAASRACREVFETQLTPHEDGEKTMLAQEMSGISDAWSENTKVVGVYNFTVDDSRTFTKVITEVSKAMQKTDNTVTLQWYEAMGGGEDEADYFVVANHADFASMDKDWTGPWEAVAAQHGKETAEEWRGMFADAVDDQWDYMYVREDDLSFTPAE